MVPQDIGRGIEGLGLATWILLTSKRRKPVSFTVHLKNKVVTVLVSKNQRPLALSSNSSIHGSSCGPRVEIYSSCLYTVRAIYCISVESTFVFWNHHKYVYLYTLIHKYVNFVIQLVNYMLQQVSYDIAWNVTVNQENGCYALVNYPSVSHRWLTLS